VRAAEAAGVCSVCSEAGSYLRLIYFVYHPTLDLRVIKKKNKKVLVCSVWSLARQPRPVNF